MVVAFAIGSYFFMHGMMLKSGLNDSTIDQQESFDVLLYT